MPRSHTPLPRAPCQLNVIWSQLYRVSGSQEVLQGTQCGRLPEMGPLFTHLQDGHHECLDETLQGCICSGVTHAL